MTHDQGEALSLGDRVAVMRAGRIVQLGDPIDVYDTPADRFVGGFLGSPPMNFLAAKVDPDGTALHVGDDAVPAPRQAGAHGGRDVLLGVRPENIDRGHRGRRRERARRGAGAHRIGRAAHGRGRRRDAQGRRPASVPRPPGDVVHLTFPPEAVRLYDAETHAL